MTTTNWKDGQHKAAELHLCSICGRAFQGMGNNARPINDGRCCDDCNKKRVLPVRIARMEMGMNPRGDKT